VMSSFTRTRAGNLPVWLSSLITWT
jgi:hypothetical protein